MTPEQLRRRVEIIRTLDVDGFIELMKQEGHGEPTRETALVALHKARTATRELPPGLRESSQRWLAGRGYAPRIRSAQEAGQ